MIILKMLDIMQLEFVTTINNVYNIYISLSLSTLLKMEFEGGKFTEISFENSIFAIMLSQWSIFLIIPCHWQANAN